MATDVAARDACSAPLLKFRCDHTIQRTCAAANRRNWMEKAATHTRPPAYLRTNELTYTRTYILTYIPTFLHTYTSSQLASLPSFLHPSPCAHALTTTSTYMCMCVYIHTCTDIHTYVRTYVRSYKNIYTDIQLYSLHSLFQQAADKYLYGTVYIHILYPSMCLCLSSKSYSFRIVQVIGLVGIACTLSQFSCSH